MKDLSLHQQIFIETLRSLVVKIAIRVYQAGTEGIPLSTVLSDIDLSISEATAKLSMDSKKAN